MCISYQNNSSTDVHNLPKIDFNETSGNIGTLISDILVSYPNKN